MIEELLELNVPALEKLFRGRERGGETRVKLPFALRLDGVGFGRNLKGFQEPRDLSVHNALLQGATEIVKQLSASGAYVTSDEVNVLILGPNLPYAGRVEKLVSISASLLSSFVSLTLNQLLTFDARIIPLESVDEAKLYVSYRARIGLNNYVGSMLEKSGVKRLEGMQLREQLAELEKLGIIVKDRPLWEWGGSSILWQVKDKGRRISFCEGPSKLIESLEMYRAPELDKKKRGQ